AYPRPTDPLLTLLPAPWYLVLFFVGAVAMRGAGCTYNDLADEDIDNQVERTRSRPLPAGKVTRRQAWIFVIIQALVGLAVLLQFNSFAIPLGIASLVIVAVYPFMKRITNWPQFVLGLAFSWGALMGWAVEFGDIDDPAIMLYIGSILWVIGYDTIYAHQDKEDDAIVGVRSTARLFGDNTKMWLSGLYGGALICFAIAFASAQVPIVALSPILSTARRLSLLWGTHCVVSEDATDLDDMVDRACRIALEEGFGKPGDRVIITAGVPLRTPGSTNMLRIAYIGSETH
ncbi:MAG: 4-hydroxybenzoate octaprenyltransferase, partial [Mesorhizobium sp.]